MKLVARHLMSDQVFVIRQDIERVNIVTEGSNPRAVMTTALHAGSVEWVIPLVRVVCFSEAEFVDPATMEIDVTEVAYPSKGK